ncbi:hypothetical protein [Micromonospora sp. NPDC049033]|uniref:hypothetical protein n=1 Tax=Micromonospora sp. NPDC049033 TaxID=3155149 RepID=UPI0034079F87
MSESSAQTARTDFLALLTAIVHQPYDGRLFDEETVADIYDALEAAKPVDVAMACTTLLLPLLRELAETRGELPEDVLRGVALKSAAVPIPPPTATY